MNKYASLYVNTETKARIKGAKPKHTTIVAFLNQVMDVYEALSPVERTQIAERLMKPASAGGASTGDGACVGSLVQQLNTAEETL